MLFSPMPQPQTLLRDIRSRLLAILPHAFTRAQLDDFVAVCHALAVPAVRARIPAASLRSRLNEMSFSDVAYDCIADLFTVDDAGGLAQIRTYFAAIDVQSVSDEQLLAYLRRLIFSKVNQGIARMYHETDPALGKIIRNIKLAVERLRQFEMFERFGEACLTPVSTDRLEHLPAYAEGELEEILSQYLHGTESIPDMLASLSRELRRREDRSRILPLVAVALLFRSIYAYSRAALPPHAAIDDGLLEHDALAVIRRSCRRVRVDVGLRYLQKKKVTPDEMDSMMDVIEEMLVAKYVDGDGAAFSLFDRLRERMPAVSQDEYRRRFRSKLEYIARRAEAGVVDRLKREI